MFYRTDIGHRRRSEGDRFELVAGKGRVEAARALGWERIWADVMPGLSKSQKLMITLSENNEREDVSPFYTAQLFKMIMDLENLDQSGLAQKLGKDRTLVAKYLSLANAPHELQQMVNRPLVDGRASAGLGGGRSTLGLSHCLEIMKAVSPEDQRKLAEDCHQKKLSVKALRTRVRQANAGVVGAENNKEIPSFVFCWKAQEVAVRARAFRPLEETQERYLAELAAALKQFCDNAASAQQNDATVCELPQALPDSPLSRPAEQSAA